MTMDTIHMRMYGLKRLILSNKKNKKNSSNIAILFFFVFKNIVKIFLSRAEKHSYIE